MSSCSRSLDELQRTMSLTRTMVVMLAWFSALFLDDDNPRERLLAKKLPDGVDLELRFLTALIIACNALNCFFFGKGFRGGLLGIDLNPFDEHEFESSKRQSLSILGLGSILKRSLCPRCNAAEHLRKIS